jgi:hypothetical protein
VQEVTPEQQGIRTQAVDHVLDSCRTSIQAKGGGRLDHRHGNWSPFDNTAMLDKVVAHTKDIALRELRVRSEGERLYRPHVDDLLIAACGLARRGFHVRAGMADRTLRAAHATVRELAQLRQESRDSWDDADLRIVYEAIAAQTPTIGPDGLSRPAVGSSSRHIFPGGPRHLLAQQVLADAADRWPADRDGMWWALMWFVQGEVTAGRTAPLRAWHELAHAQFDPDRVLRFLEAFERRLTHQRYYLPLSQRLFAPGLEANRSFSASLREQFGQEAAARRSSGGAFHRLVLEIDRYMRRGGAIR